MDSFEVTSSSERASEKRTVSSKLKEYTWLLLGVTGAGKSCLGNFLLGEECKFQESEEFDIMVSVTETASCEPGSFSDSDGLEHKIHVIDTPGLGDTRHLGKHDSKAEDIAEDAARLATELTKMMMLMRGGITAFLLVVPICHREHLGTLNLLDCLDIFGNYRNHTILVLTHGLYLGISEKDQNRKLQSVLKSRKCPRALDKVMKKVQNRHIIVEAKEWRGDPEYRNGVLKQLMSYSDDMTAQHGPYHDDLKSIGNEAVEKAKLELRGKYEDLESPEAQEAIFDFANKLLKEVILKLVRIKLADGEDVDKLKEMNEVKQSELDKLCKQKEYLKRKWEEEAEKRRKAEEERKKEELDRTKAEVALRKEEERRKDAEKMNIAAEHNKILMDEQLNAAKKDKQAALEDKQAALEEKKAAERDKHAALEDKQAALEEKKAAERDKQAALRDKVAAERDKQAALRDKVAAERNKLTAERDKMAAERDKMVAERDKMAAERDKMVAERDKMAAERDKMAAERDKMAAKRDKMAAERDKMTAERDKKAAGEGMQKAESRVQETIQELEAWQNRGFLRRLVNAPLK